MTFFLHSLFSFRSHYSYSFIHTKSPAVFLSIFFCLITFFSSTSPLFNLTFSLSFFPALLVPLLPVFATSTHRPAVISHGLQSKPKGREIKDLHCSQRPPRSKGGYISRLSRTHRCTHTGKIWSYIYTGTWELWETWSKMAKRKMFSAMKLPFVCMYTYDE